MSGHKIAIVTGATRGLGRSMAGHLARTGTGVIATYRRGQDEAEQFVAEAHRSGVPAAALPLDVGDSTSFRRFAEGVRVTLADFGTDRFDYLVNNAGIGTYATFADTSEDQFDELVRIQFKGPFFLTQALLPLLTDGGRILNVSSGLARFTNPGFAAYAATKGAIEVVTRRRDRGLAPRGVPVERRDLRAGSTDRKIS